MSSNSQKRSAGATMTATSGAIGYFSMKVTYCVRMCRYEYILYFNGLFGLFYVGPTGPLFT